MAVSYTIPKVLTLKSTDEYVFAPDPYARHNVKLYLYAETLDNTVTFYDSQGSPQEPIAVTSGLEIIAKNANYRKVTFSDPNSYSIYMVLSEAVYSSDTDLTCIPPSVDLSIAPLSINVNISAQTISQLSVNVAAWNAGTLAVNISAQSVGNLAVNIAAQSMGNLAVNLAAVSATTNLNVNLAAQSANINVALAASSVTLDINLSSITAGVVLDVSVQNASLTVVVSGTAQVNIASTTGNIPVSIAASSATVTVSVSGTADVNISSQTGNLDVNLAASAITLDVNISSQSSNLNVNLAAISATTNLNVAIASSSVTLDVNISSQTANINVALAASSITLTTQGSVPITIGTDTYQSIPVSIVAQQIGNLNVNLAAQTVGNISVDIAANSAGNITVSLAAIATTANLNINLAASAITLNVNITNASITITGSVTISGVPAVTINAGSAIIGSLNEIISPVSVRTKLATGYQESVEYINYDGSSFFVSGSNGDSASDYKLGSSVWAVTPATKNSGNLTTYATIGQQYTVGASPMTIIGLATVLGVGDVTAGSVLVRCAIYSDNSNKIGSLLYQSRISLLTVSSPSALTYFDAAAFFSSPVTLAASTAYWCVFTFLPTSMGAAGGTTTPSVSLPSSTSTLTGVFITLSSINGFPLAASYTSGGSGLPVSMLVANLTTTSSLLTINQPVTSAVTLNGQLVFKLSLSAHMLAEIGITSLTYSIEDTTTSTYLVNNKTVNVAVQGLGIVSVADFEDVGPVTLNAGDTLQIVVSSLTWYSGTIDGSTGSVDAFLDSLDGNSYVVLPLQ